MTCRDVFKRLIELLGEVNHAIDVDGVYGQILRRESCGIALAGPKVAVVHVRVEELKRLRIAIATSRQGLRCAAILDGGTCPAAEVLAAKLIVLVLAPLEDPAGYLRTIAALSKVCRRKGFVEQIVSLDDPQLVWEAFQAANEHLPSYVKAADIMRQGFQLLHDTDTLSNAIDACALEGIMSGKGTVTVKTSRPKGWALKVDVTDTGIGIEKKIQKKLYTGFFSTKGSKGTGLGLSVTQKIVHEHKGELTFKTQVGKGTTFTLLLPEA